jgi:hypothetical protein
MMTGSTLDIKFYIAYHCRSTLTWPVQAASAAHHPAAAVLLVVVEEGREVALQVVQVGDLEALAGVQEDRGDREHLAGRVGHLTSDLVAVFSWPLCLY